MKARFIAGIFASALFIAVACSTANMTSYTPVNEKTKYSADTLFRAARNAAEELDFVVTAGEGSTTFDTREKQVATSSIPRLSYKYTFHVETADGVLSIQSTCSKNSSTNETDFHDCGDDRPQRVVEFQEKLHKLTLKRAGKDQEGAPDWSHYGEPEAPPDAGKVASKDSDKDDKGKSGDKADSKQSGKDSKESADKDSKDSTKDTKEKPKKASTKK